MTPVYARSNLFTDVSAIVTSSVAASDFNAMANKAIRDMFAEIDIRSSIRKTALSPNLFDDIFEYTAPTDLKGDKLIDIKPQIKRGRFDEWILRDPTEFDRKKEDHRTDMYGDPIELNNSQWLGDNICAVDTYDFVRKVLVSRPIDDKQIVISEFDSVGSWVALGDAESIEANADDYVKGNMSVKYDISSAGGTTAGLQNSSLTSTDISDYIGTGSAFIWAYITSATNITNFILRIGSSASAYYSMTATSDNAGNAFRAGWNLIRFSFSGKSTTGSPDATACDYAAIYMTKAEAKTDEQGYRFDWLVLKLGDHYDLQYYSKYGWQTAAGVFIENATQDTDKLNVDTDEYDMAVVKTAEYCERYILKNQSEADFRKREYEEKKKNYIFENPSRAMLLVQNYYMR